MSGELSFGNHELQNRDTWGDRKDSVTNAERTGEFVWNMATYDLREAVNRSAQAVGPEIDEFALAGVTKAPSILVKPPRVAESPIQFDCTYQTTLRLPGNSTGPSPASATTTTPASNRPSPWPSPATTRPSSPASKAAHSDNAPFLDPPRHSC